MAKTYITVEYYIRGIKTKRTYYKDEYLDVEQARLFANKEFKNELIEKDFLSKDFLEEYFSNNHPMIFYITEK